MVDYLLAWQNLIFLIPLCGACLLVFGSAMGLGHDVDIDHDIDHDIGHDSGHDAGGGHDSSIFSRTLSLFGVGKVPLMIILMMAGFVFGGVGLIINQALAPILRISFVYAPISAIAAFVAMVFLTGWLARLVNRLLPTFETNSVQQSDLVGCTGTIVIAVDAKGGFAQIIDRHHDLHQVACRALSGSDLPRGCPVVVAEYKEEDETFLVDKFEQ